MCVTPYLNIAFADGILHLFDLSWRDPTYHEHNQQGVVGWSGFAHVHEQSVDDINARILSHGQ